MAKSESADTLLKRLQKIERAQARLGDITSRIRVQADTLGELLVVARAFVDEKAGARAAGRARSATGGVRKPTTARRAAARPGGARGSGAPDGAVSPGARPAAAAATRRAPRPPASA